jgi:hypothetical protein
MALSLRFYLMGKSKNAGTYFHFGFIRSRDDNVHGTGNVNAASLGTPWGRPVFDTTWGTDQTRGWKTGYNVGFRFEDWLGKDKRFYLRSEIEFMTMIWERDFSDYNPIASRYGAIFVTSNPNYRYYYTIPDEDYGDDIGQGQGVPAGGGGNVIIVFPGSTGGLVIPRNPDPRFPIPPYSATAVTGQQFWWDPSHPVTNQIHGRLPQLHGWGISFGTQAGFNLFEDIEGSMLYMLFKFDYSDVDNASSDNQRFGAQIPGQRIWNYTTGIGYAFNKFVRFEFNYIVTLLDHQDLYGGAKNDRFTYHSGETSTVNYEPPSDNQGSDDVEHTFFFQGTVQF